MKLCGEFVIREAMDQILAIPVGAAAQKLNGMILLNDVSCVIFQTLQQETDQETLLAAVLEKFDVNREEAEGDIREFLDQLRSAQLLQE